jgi:hypothetical protein
MQNIKFAIAEIFNHDVYADYIQFEALRFRKTGGFPEGWS